MREIFPVDDPKKIFLKAMALAVEGKYEIDSENKKQIADLVGYFSKTMTTLNPRKGILIIGNPGSGKTMLLEISGLLVRNIPSAFKTITCSDVSEAYSSGGQLALEHLWRSNYFFDDIGHEVIANRFGKRDAMFDVIEKTYDAWRKSGLNFHFTSNLGVDGIIERYGVATWSRLAHMCNVIGLGINATDRDRRTATIPNVLFGPNATTFPKYFETDEERNAAEEKERIRKQYEILENTPLQKVAPGNLGQQMKQALGMTGSK